MGIKEQLQKLMLDMKANIRDEKDLKYVQEYFQNQEKRNPTITEI